jgi:hypothetical protein
LISKTETLSERFATWTMLVPARTRENFKELVTELSVAEDASEKFVNALRASIERRKEIIRQYGFSRPNPPKTAEEGALEALEWVEHDLNEIVAGEKAR